MSKHEIQCVVKSDRYNPHERIRYIGGRNADGTRWKISQEEAVSGIESGKWSFFVHQGGRIADVIVAVSRFGNKYIKTVADGEHPDNLLSLNACPV